MLFLLQKRNYTKVKNTSHKKNDEKLHFEPLFETTVGYSG
jgi:hypothetical protein